MIFPLFGRSRRHHTISVLYGMIVAQARMPSFYRDYLVPDTVNGRFDLIVLHLSLLMDRFAEDSALRELGQEVFNRFCEDMDHSLREMGFGDLAVPKEMRRMGEAFYGRAEAYRTALAVSDNDALTEALRRNIYGGSAPKDAVERLAAYVRETVRALQGQATASLIAGKLHFPEPTTGAG